MRLGDIRLRAKTRLCQDQTGCQDWQNASEVPFYKVIWSGNSYVTSSPTSIALPATGTVDLSITSSSTAIALKVAGLELGDSSSLSNNFSWSFGMPKLGGASVQVGSWLPSSGNYLAFQQKKITRTCIQALSTGRIYSTSSNGQYTEITASIYGKYDPPTPPTPPTPSTNTVFDKGWCSGSPITKTEALAKSRRQRRQRRSERSSSMVVGATATIRRAAGRGSRRRPCRSTR